jgi:hypothetical protein
VAVGDPISAAPAPAAPAAPKADAPAPGQPNMDEMMKEWAKMMTPGAPHEVLKAFEGRWHGEGSWTDSGMTSKYTEDVTGSMVFGGRFLKIEGTMKSEVPNMPEMSMSSLGFLGYDNAKQKYTQAMIGDWSTAVGTMEGTYDAATKTFTMRGTETMGEGKERKFRMQTRIVSKDEWRLDMWFAQPDGTEAHAGGGVYKRR